VWFGGRLADVAEGARSPRLSTELAHIWTTGIRLGVSQRLLPTQHSTTGSRIIEGSELLADELRKATLQPSTAPSGSTHAVAF